MTLREPADGPHRKPPRYPPRAIRARAAGHVALEQQVSVTGGVVAVRVLDAHPPGYFEEAAVREVLRHRYAPHRVDGRPTCVVFTRTIRFELSDDPRR